MYSGRKCCSVFFTQLALSISVHISGSIRPITLIWVSQERSFPLPEVEHRRWQFWSKVMTSEVEERPRLLTAGYGLHGSQWVNYVRACGFVWGLAHVVAFWYFSPQFISLNQITSIFFDKPCACILICIWLEIKATLVAKFIPAQSL